MNANFVIMGLPASGKTTFLAALWHLIEADETGCRLSLDGYSGDFTHLNRIAEAWRTFKKVPRTSQVGDKLRDNETGVSGAAFFPDLAGEVFDIQVEERRCRSEFIEEVSADDGILFFINADVKNDTLSVTELNARLPDQSSGEPCGAGRVLEATNDESSVGSLRREWDPKLLPVQVKVVQMLSDLLRPPFSPRRRRLALLISAWDLTRGMGLEPLEWLAAHMPLVDQFLKSNDKAFEHQVYGVSAQGVNLEDASAVVEITRLIPSKRIQIVGPGSEDHDLTVPIVWLMSVGE